MHTELIEKLEAQDENTRRVDFKFSDLHITYDSGRAVVDSKFGQMNFSNNGMLSLLESLKIPRLYIERCPADLRERNIQHWLKNNNSTGSALVENETIRAFMNPSHIYVSTSKVFKNVLAEIPDGYVANFSVDDDATEIVLFSEDYDTDVIDSKVKAGIRLLYSDSWKVYPRFDASLCRIACFNSALAPLTKRSFRVSGKNEQEIIDYAVSLTRESIAKIPEMLSGFALLDREPIENFLVYLKSVCRDNKIPKSVQQTLIEAASSPEFLATASRSHIETLYDVANLFTYVASHVRNLGDNHRDMLFSVAGNLMLTQDHRCGSCGTTIE